MSDRIEVENVGQPGKTNRVDATKYCAMRDALLPLLPDAAPGLTPRELLEAVTPVLPQ